MKLIRNTGNDRVIDELRRTLASSSSLDLASAAFSLFAFAELREVLEKLDTCRVILPEVNGADLGLTGSDNDRAFRNRLQARWLARECAAWIKRTWSCARSGLAAAIHPHSRDARIGASPGYHRQLCLHD